MLRDAGDLKEFLTAQRTAVTCWNPLVTQTNAQSRRDVSVAERRPRNLRCGFGKALTFRSRTEKKYLRKKTEAVDLAVAGSTCK
jgi:hypothetical protein